MRMKLNKTSQLLLVGAASILTAGLLSACSTLTTDFVYVTSAKAAGSNSYGEINIYEINSESGRMRQIPASPMYSQGRNPVAEAVSTDNANLFVVNKDDNTIVQFTIGSDGKLYPYTTVNTPGIYPMGIAVTSSNAFVLDTYKQESNCTTASPCSGSIGVFPVTAATSSAPETIVSTTANGSLAYWPLCKTGYKSSTSSGTTTYSCSGTESDVLVPTSIVASKNGSYVYVSAYDSTLSPTVGYIFSFSVGTNGALTPVAVLSAGVKPSALATDATGSYLYATDATGNDVLGYSVSSGVLTALSGSPYTAGNSPSAIVVNPAYNFVYVTNSTDSTVMLYSMKSGVLTFQQTYTTGLYPIAIGIDPSTNRFLYTANYSPSESSGSVSGWQLSTTDGTLVISQNSPYSSNALPTAVAAVPHK